MRLVQNQTPKEVFEKIQAHVNKTNPDIVLTFRSGKPTSETPTDLPVSKCIVDAIRTAYDKEPLVMARLGATSPEYVFTQVLGIPTIFVPYANADEDNHAPNENMTLDCFYTGIHATAQVLQALSQMDKIERK